MQRFLIILGLLVALVSRSVFGQQALVLADGRYYEGETIQKTASILVFRTKVGAIAADLTFKMSEVVSLKDLAKLPGPIVGSAISSTKDLSAERLDLKINLTLPEARGPLRFVRVQDGVGAELFAGLSLDPKESVVLSVLTDRSKKPQKPGDLSAEDSEASSLRAYINAVEIFVSMDGKMARRLGIRQGNQDGYEVSVTSPLERLVIVDLSGGKLQVLSNQQLESLAKLESKKAELQRRASEELERRTKQEAQAAAERAGAEKAAAEKADAEKAAAEKAAAEKSAADKAAAEKAASEAKRKEDDRKADAAARAVERRRLLATGKEADVVASFDLLVRCVQDSLRGGARISITDFDVERTNSLISPFRGILEGDSVWLLKPCHWTIKFSVRDGDWRAAKIEGNCGETIDFVASDIRKALLECGCP